MQTFRTLAMIATLAMPVAARAQGGGMHDWGMGWGGMWLGPLLMIGWIALIVALIVAVVRWLGVGVQNGGRAPTARHILDERYARGEIDREEYLRRRQDIDGR